MQVIIGKHGGFCFGVKRAIDKALSLSETKTYILGEIIHNENIVNKLSSQGLITIQSLDDVKFNSGDNLLIRTHGEGKKVFDKANELGLNVIDCTCPFVKDIQKIVEKHYKDGYTIAIIGSSNHPEIIGINGWCDNKAIICEDELSLSNINAEKLCVVVQTTYSEKKFEKIIKNFDSSKVKSVDIFKTICYTTTMRQKEAEQISKICSSVLVLGGANSNNTNKLFEICSKFCSNTFRIVSTNEFDYEKIKSFNKVGIIMGASTPIEQFQEVIQNMEKVTTEEIKTTSVSEDAVAQEENVSVKSEMEKAFDNIKPSRDFRIGQIVTVYISSANDEGLAVSLKNSKSDFIIPKNQLLNEYDKEAFQNKIGQEMRVMVTAKNPLQFSERAMEKVIKEEAEVEEIRNGKIFEAVITATNKGGLTGKYGSYQVFVPASQIKLGFVKELDKYIGKTLRLKAEKVESRGARRQIIASQRVILVAEKEERDAIKAQKEAEFFASIQEGDVVLGTPVRFAAFGAFIDVNGFDCLAHISDLCWTGCKDCSEVLEIGKQAEFKILKIDVEKKKVSVGYKQLQPKPWDTVAERYNVGDVIKGKVVRLVNFGAFVEVEKGIDGLVHVSQISNQWLENPVTALEVGQEIDAKILDINVEKEKMTLSIKALLPEVEKPVEETEKPAKGKKRAKAEVGEEEPELREWKDDDNGGASIADLIGNIEK